MSPVQILAVSLAYMIDVDNSRPAEERAELVVVFGKMVTRGEISDAGLAELVRYAFDYAGTKAVDDFLAEVAPTLAPLQKMAIYVNALDIMLADGKVVESEQSLLKKMQDAFAIDHDTIMAVREVLYVKNDTRMFLHPEHPRNSLDAFLRISYQSPRSS
jgi:uncharacterized tellurite resistance protein B-like protein